MANIKSSAKRDEKSKQLRAKNRADKTELKTMMKKFDAAVSEGNKEAAVNAYKVAVKTVDRAAGKGLLPKNNASRKKSAMTVKLNGLSD
ncbi:MAG: 30S ribosomal protein S20 [Oscillospiraceae bacterium]|nr:30S ribosomal protein S20 [Oscillospiraceae bacterium]